ncbi:hypothetical protein IAD21_00125 [Abditibacteriota bacterium]|nr:hypothetical protein IAD21_00125 [Abditibacteriota bacterium]
MSNFWRSPFVIVCFATLAIMLSGVSRPVAAATFTVNLSSDFGDFNLGDGACDVDSESLGTQCTLRAALQEANASSGADTINFAIPGAGVQTIKPGVDLPSITDAVTIDGYTQSGSRPNTSDTSTNAVILIELNGVAAPPAANGLYISSNSCTVRGLAINGFGGNGIRILGDDNHVTGCFIGTNAAGTAAAANGGNGIQMSGVSLISNSSIGGNVAAAKNLISANGANGILLQNFSSNDIQGNIIGTKADTTGSLGNGGNGIAIVDSSSNLIGGLGAAVNIVSRNGGNGISISNSSSGTNNLVTSNQIFFNGGCGIQITSSSSPADTQIRGNAIYSNGALGIDLGGDGVTPNDADDTDSGPNELQNFPVLSPASMIGTGTTNVPTTLHSTPNTHFVVDFFESHTADPSGFGEGEQLIVSFIADTDSGGNVSFIGSSRDFYPGGFITATATAFPDVSTGNNAHTSEFSAPVGLLPSLAINDVSVTEGTGGTNNAVFTVTLSQASSDTVKVDYATVDGFTNSATAPADYTASSGTLTFAPGQTTQTITVPIVTDVIDEGNENLQVFLSNSINAGLGKDRATGTIVDDDTSGISISDAAVAEAKSGTSSAVFTVTLSTPSPSPISVNFATQDGTATAPADYTAQSGTLTIAAGKTTGLITVTVVSDGSNESNETFTVRLSNASSGVITDGTGTGTIQDNGKPPLVSISDVTVTEGSRGTTNAVFTVTLSAASAQSVSVAYASANGSAVAPADYTARSGTLTFAAGQTTKTIAVPIRPDVIDEIDENFFVNLRNPTNATLLDAQGQGTIRDDDTGSVSISDVTITEGSGRASNAVFTVTLSSASAQAVSVTFTTQDGSATAPADYTARSGKLTIPAGKTTGTITVPIVGDTLKEPSESFTVRLSSPINATLSDAVGLCTIQDDDVLALNLRVTPNVVTEGAVTTATITRSGSNNSAALRITVASNNSRVTLPTTVVIPAGAASTTFNVNAVDNQIADGDLNVTVTASATGFISSSAAFLVRDNEPAGLKLSVAPDAFVENAGNAAAIGTITRNTSSSAALTVALKSSNTGAATVPASVTIAAGATIATFPIAAVDDAAVNGVRSAVITASATGLLSATARVKVADNDNTGRPPNDNFNQAQSITGAQGTVIGRTQSATHETGEPNHADSDGIHSVWYAWTAPASGTVIFDTEGSDFDTVLAIYTGTAVNALTLIDDDDDGGTGATSQVRFGAVAGRRYFIAVDGFRDEQGSLVLRWNLATGKPANDDIARAQVIVGNAGQVPGDNRGATQESGEPRHADQVGGASVWYQWTAPASGTATFDTRGSVFDTLLAVYATNTNPPRANALTAVASNDDTSVITIADGDDDDTDDDDTDDLTSRVSFEAVAGRTYFIAVDGFQGDQGALVLHWSLSVSSGDPIRWDKKDASGQGQSGNWNNPDNWLPRRVPQFGDLVSIKLPGTYSVNLDVDANVSGIAVGGSSGAATLAIANKRLVLRGRSTVAGTGIVQLSGGILSLSSDCIVSGALGWSGGQLQGVGTLHMLGSAHLSIIGGTAKVLALNVLENDGGATWEGNGPLVLSANASFVNNGQFTSRVAGIVRNQGAGESPAFFNYGTFTSTSVGTSQFIGVEFWNAGRGNIQAGFFQLRGGGASYGIFDIANGARLQFSSDFFFAKDASQIIGGGQAEQIGGTFVVNTDDGEPVDVRDFELSAGNLNGANSQSRLEVNEFDWTGGGISGKGQITLKDNFRISGSGSRPLMGQTLTSQGNADWNGAEPLTIGDGAAINIQGNLYARDGFTVNTSPGVAPVLNNSGSIKPGDAAPDANVKTRALTPLSTGILNIFCNYHQAASGILNLDVRGTRPGSDYDQVNVRGNLIIDPGAKIVVNLPTGVTPRVGDSYRVVTFTERHGEFLLDLSKVVSLPPNLSLKPVYSANALDLVVVSSIVTEAPFISGRVTDGQGNGLANVTVKRVSANNQVVTTTTDGSGYYAFNRMPPGNYLVSPVANGYLFGIASVTVSTTQNAPDTNFAGTPLNSSNSSKADVGSNTASAPSS